jgi:alpha-L-rhamnosidase
MSTQTYTRARGTRAYCTWSILLVGILLWGLRAEGLPPMASQSSQAPVAYLPLVALQAGGVLSGYPIWAAADTRSGAVALFRGTFVLETLVSDVELGILADTRYEVWLDGDWIGRGPARFSRERQEFDLYPIGSLPPGAHLLAVLVHYAPNVRRSQDLGAGIQASLWGQVARSRQEIVRTDGQWRAILSPAWDADADPVNRRQLIGPMELLDLRRLPADWMQPAFDDTSWPYARVLSPSPFSSLTPRTIPLLSHVPRIPVHVVESGLLSPGRQIIEFEHSSQNGPAGVGMVTRALTVTAASPVTLRIEGIETDAVRVDGIPMDWQALRQERRPDVVVAERSIQSGEHTLAVDVPPQGRTLAIHTNGLRLQQAPEMTVTHNPGRRTLLADPSPGGATAPTVQLTAAGAEIEVPAGEAPRYVVLDLGRTVHGRLDVLAEGPAGTIVDVGWDERLTGGRPLPAPGSLVGNLWSQVDSWVLDGTARRLSTLDTRAGRYLLIQVFGPGAVRLRHLQAVEETYPVQQTGWFSSTDVLLNEVWQTGVNSLIPNMTDAYTDTPWRERGQWWGDALVAFHVNQAAFGDLALFRRGLRQMADGIGSDGRPAALVPRNDETMLVDYGMLWIEGLYSYWQLSEDLALVDELYPAAQRLLAYLASYEGDMGLLDLAPAHWSQSALVDWPAVTSRSGESTVLNALYAANLRQIGEMGIALDDHTRGSAYLAKSQAVTEAINRRLYVDEHGCYAASRRDSELVAPSPHAQAWALRYDIVPRARQDAVARCLADQLDPFFNEEGWTVVETYGMFWTLEALARTDQTTVALDLIRAQYGRLLDQGATTWWEVFTPNQGRGQSLSHVWGSSPTWFLSTHVLGGQVLGPTRWRIAPHLGGLERASGALPMPGGSIEIDWVQERCGELEVTFAAPGETSGEILLPVAADARVTLDGVLIWDGGPVHLDTAHMMPQGLQVTELAGGSHHLSALFPCQGLLH